MLPREPCVQLGTVAATGPACEGPEEGWMCRDSSVSCCVCAEQPLLLQGLSSACIQRPGQQVIWVGGNWTYDSIKTNSLGRKCFEITGKKDFKLQYSDILIRDPESFLKLQDESAAFQVKPVPQPALIRWCNSRQAGGCACGQIYCSDWFRESFLVFSLPSFLLYFSLVY